MKVEHGSLLLLTEEFKADHLFHNQHIRLFKLSLSVVPFLFIDICRRNI